jgi:dipeptidyl aminopeptidase/acylaminoacyl peptidase
MRAWRSCWAAATKKFRRWRDASPVYHVNKSDTPFLIVHGITDNIVPIAQAEELYQKLQAAGVSVRLIKLDGGHTFDTPETKRQLAFESLEFFQQNLATNP